MTTTGADAPGEFRWEGGLDYPLPPELIAQSPPPLREEARLMVLDRAAGTIEHMGLRDLPSLLPAPALLVANDSKVFRARLRCHKTSGGRVEFLVLRIAGAGPFEAMFRTSKALREGQVVQFGAGKESLTVVGPVEAGRCRIDFGSGNAAELLERYGEVPLPPYIRRESGTSDLDAERYQTVYARDSGSVAAPTAGLHLTHEMIEQLSRKHIRFASLTLHVGPGTFTPVRTTIEEHEMESERYSITQDLQTEVAAAKRDGFPVVAVGTTSVRALESAASSGQLLAGDGSTRLFITPGHRFQIVEALLTNFHLPGSTLLALVMAFAGEDLIRRAYEAAVRERYRFYSFGDAMLIL